MNIFSKDLTEFTIVSAYGHMGRNSKFVSKTFASPNGESKTLEVELFSW
jgi:S-adenosylmethionine synthetase